MRPGDAATRRLFRYFLAAYWLFCAMAAALSFRGRPAGLIAGDGKGYYAWLRSIAFDRDLDFANDYQLLYPPEPLPPQMHSRTVRGSVPDKYPVGLALVEVPGFLMGHAVALATGFAADGVSPPYQFAITLWLQLVCVAGAWCLFLALLRMEVHAKVAALTVGAALVATNLIHYIASPTLAHGPGFAVLCVTTYVAVRAREESRPSLLALAGFLMGIAAIVRPTNLALAPFVLACFSTGRPSTPRGIAACIAAFAAPLALQLALASLAGGELQFTGYTDEGFSSGAAGIVATLTSARHGLFVYHPWYLVSLAVCVFALRERTLRGVAAGSLVSFAALAVANGTWDTWWFGDSFGNRAFIEIIPAFVTTQALWLERVGAARRRPVALAFVTAALVACAANAVLWSGFILRRYPANGDHTIAQVYLWPWHH